MNRSRSLIIALAVLGSTVVGVVPAARSAVEVPAPTVTLPPAGVRGYALWDSYYELAPFGYEEQEYFVSGTARDASGAPAAYTTRMIVFRPSDPAAFNGSVMLDWTNVTAQFENAVDTMEARELLMRKGFAYVHVSAQAAGVCCTPLTPKVWDPVRYAALDHPGDAWASDMFSQVAQAFKAPSTAEGSLDPMEGLDVARVLAAGQSQSGSRLYGYVNEWLPAHPEAVGLIDGFLIHGSSSSSKSFAWALPVKVLHLLSDAEAYDDGVDPATVDPNYRLWEVAGTAHSDYFIGYQSEVGMGPRVLAGAPKLSKERYLQVIEDAGNYGERLHPLLATCILAGSTMPMHYAASTAIHRLDQWAAGGPAPANGPRFEFDALGRLALDQHGNARGGIRLPPIDVPVATYRTTDCGLGGFTVPFTDVQLRLLYQSHANYYSLMQERTNEAVAAGWLLPDDGVDLMEKACAARIRFQELPGPCAGGSARSAGQGLETWRRPATPSLRRTTLP